MSAFINFITLYSPLRRNQQQSSEIGISADDEGEEGGSAGGGADGVVDGVVGSAAGGRGVMTMLSQ